jgi:hypothetical protein
MLYFSDREWVETMGWLGFDPTRSRAHCMLDEEHVGRTPHQITCHFTQVLPLEYIYQNYIYFVRVLLVASANGKIDVAGRSFS